MIWSHGDSVVGICSLRKGFFTWVYEGIRESAVRDGFLVLFFISLSPVIFLWDH